MLKPEPLFTLAESIREATTAIATSDLPRLEEILGRQQRLVGLIAANRNSVSASLRQRPEIALRLSMESAVMTRVLSRASRNCRVLLSLVKTDEALYSLKTLPRR
jgi:hypothetical protein